VLVNLSSAAPASVDGWARIAEIIDADAGRRNLGRDRYRAYRERGFTPATHEMRGEP
jgi:DNA polymerase-3 subunit chi